FLGRSEIGGRWSWRQVFASRIHRQQAVADGVFRFIEVEDDTWQVAGIVRRDDGRGEAGTVATPTKSARSAVQAVNGICPLNHYDGRIRFVGGVDAQDLAGLVRQRPLPNPPHRGFAIPFRQAYGLDLAVADEHQFLPAVPFEVVAPK